MSSLFANIVLNLGEQDKTNVGGEPARGAIKRGAEKPGTGALLSASRLAGCDRERSSSRVQRRGSDEVIGDDDGRLHRGVNEERS